MKFMRKKLIAGFQLQLDTRQERANDGHGYEGGFGTTSIDSPENRFFSAF